MTTFISPDIHGKDYQVRVTFIGEPDIEIITRENAIARLEAFYNHTAETLDSLGIGEKLRTNFSIYEKIRK